MRRIKQLCVWAVLAAVLTATQAFAQDVYVTKYGKKYHTEDSRFIKGKEVEKLSLEEAEAQGYEPSSEFLRKQKAQDSGDQAE